MEAAPLTLAHTHARNAVLETRKSNPVAASEEHDLAAGEFATAAQNCLDHEALRTLHLLEQHHKSLARILRFHHERPFSDTTSGILSPRPIVDLPITDGPLKISSSGPDTHQQLPRLSRNVGALQRNNSSIASNLASARGIPPHPLRPSPVSPALSSQQAGARMTGSISEQKFGDPMPLGPKAYIAKDRVNRASTAKHSKPLPVVNPTTATLRQATLPDPIGAHQQGDKRRADEPFQRFYSTFEGLISKLSAPLAFAGLPLGPEDTAQTENSGRKPSSDVKLNHHAVLSRTSSFREPDVDKLYSRAALRAIRDGNGGTGNAAESFYVVPTTGGTVSYAGILSRAERETKSNAEEVEEDFVDARETPASPELRQSISGTKNKSSRGVGELTSLQNSKTMEELQMENQALKHLSDTLSKRLHMWEVNAQSSSAALRQSLKAMHQQSSTLPDHAPQQSSAPSPVAIAGTPAVCDFTQRIKYLEENARRNEKELDRLSHENEKLRNILGRYRERWEKLKEGAKSRRAEAKGGNDNNASASSATAKRADSIDGEQDGGSPILQPEGERDNDNASEPSPVSGLQET